MIDFRRSLHRESVGRHECLEKSRSNLILDSKHVGHYLLTKETSCDEVGT